MRTSGEIILELQSARGRKPSGTAAENPVEHHRWGRRIDALLDELCAAMLFRGLDDIAIQDAA